MSDTKNQSIIHFNDATKLYNIKLYDEALKLYSKSVDADVTFADAHFCIAKTQIRLKEYKSGIAHFCKYIHLIPEKNQGKYTLALSNILNEENKPDEALKLIQQIDIDFTEEQTFKILPLLLCNHRMNEAIHKIINLSTNNKIKAGHKKLLENESTPETIKKSLKDDNIIPRFLDATNQIRKLKSAGIQHKEYFRITQEANGILKELRTERQNNYALELQKIDELKQKAQSILDKEILTIISDENFDYADKLINILKYTDYESKKVIDLRRKLEFQRKLKNQKNIKIVLIVTSILIVVILAVYFLL